MANLIQYRARRGNVWHGSVNGLGFDYDLDTNQVTIVDSLGKAYPNQNDYAELKSDIIQAGLNTNKNKRDE